MSRYTPELDRNGIQWQEPVGTWKEEQDIVHLATIAEHLAVPVDEHNTDLLNSIPTPWSRLLLFENALYNPQHPSHREVLDQWRGLLGLLALAKPLGLNIQPSSAEYTINLSNFVSEHPIAKTFIDLRPRYIVNDSDVEAGKWERFHLIAVGDHLLGATSPRTLVFTAINHQCPPAVPFVNGERRISDPLAYYRRFGDAKYLTLLKQWLQSFIAAISDGERTMSDWLGTFPAAQRVTALRRHDKLIGLLKQWKMEIDRAVPPGSAPIPLGPHEPLFTWPPYNLLLFLPRVPPINESDLLLDTAVASQKRVVVCFRADRSQNPKRSSMLYNEHGQLMQAGSLLVCDGRWMRADELLPESLDFLPEGWEYISDPIAELFEEHLIEVKLPDASEGADSVYSLQVNNKTFLYPFKKEIRKYFTPAELHRYTRIEVDQDKGYRVILELPLVKGRSIRAVRRYEEAAQELVLMNNPAKSHLTSELTMWPSFADPNWNHYFYFKRQIAGEAARNLDFTPEDAQVPRSSPDAASHWYYTNAPVQAFVGTVGGRSGLLLPKYERLPPEGERDRWKVAVDFGSTHTRVFYLRVQKGDGESYSAVPGAEIEQLDFSADAKPLTLTYDQIRLKNDFFALAGKLDPPTRAELKTLLMQPVNDSADQPDWRPREGYSYMHWIQGGFDDRKLKTDIKWENSGNKNDLRSFLRCLMVMVQAEAMKRNASIVSVERSFPSAFSVTLAAEHNAEWVALGAAMGMKVESEREKIVSEAIATARYLVSERAPAISNTVSLDVGGSTTDIAVWYGSRERPKPTLGIQESVKMAADVVGRYLQSDPTARTFLEWFVRTVKDQGVFQDLSLDSFAGRRNGYALMFYNTLTYYELGGAQLQNKFNALLGLIKARSEARGLLVHLIYLFGSLVYYAGLLARKAGLHEKQMPVYYLYFCGKGGTLITWIDKYQLFVEKMFIAGLYGPQPAGAQTQRAPVKVEVKISEKPKQEVGRGLLVDKLRQVGDEDEESFGLINPKQPSVTVGETGYRIRQGDDAKELTWKDELEVSVLRDLDGELPTFEQMTELNCFIKAVQQAFKYQDEKSPTLDFNRILTTGSDKHLFVDSLRNRLLGEDDGCVLHDLEQENNPHALVEPLLITEMKVLLEHLSGNEKLFK